MSNRSNQPNEGSNKFRNFVGRDVVRQGSKPSLESWATQQKCLENEAVGQWMELFKKGENYKKKNPYYVRSDGVIDQYVAKYRALKLTQDAYFQMCVDALKETWSPWDF